MTSYLLILVGAALVNNFVMNQYLGICPFLGVSKKVETAVGMGVAVTFVMALASLICWLLYYYVLVPLNITYMQTIAFILTIAALVQFVEMVIQKSSPSLYSALGVYLPLITTNCAVLGVTILNVDSGYNFGQSMLNAFASGAGFMLAMVLFAGVRERLETADIPESLKGLPITLVSASLVSVSFLGFQGLFGF